MLQSCIYEKRLVHEQKGRLMRQIKNLEGHSSAFEKLGDDKVIYQTRQEK
jgi:hypothetical protein